MCGIAGACWSLNPSAVSAAELDAMTDAVSHRGPDGRGVFYRLYSDGSGVGLGHRRLAIIDLEGGKQPLCNEDGTVWITFNGEIYNYEELRASLEKRGHRFQTHSDTETIVHLYEEYGVDCLEHLRGMFAFAIWDEPRRRLFFARDRLGEKPFVYQAQGERFLFGSEIKSLLCASREAARVDPESVLRYLTYFYVPHPHTMFQGIRKLPPAHYGIWERGHLTIHPYWSPDWNLETDRPLSEIREQLAHELSESVRMKLRSDVPLGAFLSGGIDSTVIVGLMQRHLERPAKTYTIGFDVAQFDERPYARAAAEHLRTEHHELQVSPTSTDILPRLVWHFDEPFGDSSAVPTWYVARMTRQHVTVALTGDGGDELFAGYPRYHTVESLGRFDRLPRFIQRIAANSWWRRTPAGGSERSFWTRLRRRMLMLREAPEQRYVHWIAPYPEAQRNQLLSTEFARELKRDELLAPITSRYGAGNRRSAGIRAMQTDLMTYLPDDLLAKVDITSMAHALECRAPFLDHRVVELAVSLPFAYFTAGEGSKPLLTTSLPDLVPAPLRKRGKTGFRVPLDAWFRGELRSLAHDTLRSSTCASRGYFAPGALDRLLEEHDQGRWNHGDRIWAILFLELWHRQFIDGSTNHSAPALLAG